MITIATPHRTTQYNNGMPRRERLRDCLTSEEVRVMQEGWWVAVLDPSGESLTLDSKLEPDAYVSIRRKIPADRALEVEEMRNQMLDHVWSLIDHWDQHSRAETTREKLRGLAFGICTMLEGATDGIPAFVVAPEGGPDLVEAGGLSRALLRRDPHTKETP